MINKEFTTNQGYKIVILEYKNNRNCTIKFLCNGFIKNTTYQHILSGNVKNPYHKSIFGVGFLGVGKYKSKENNKITKYYSVWKGMFERCYNEKLQQKYPTYKDVKVCEEWHNFQNFAEWFKDNYIEGFHLDKDILCKECKIYSPNTCAFVPVEINSLLTKTNALRGNTLIGVFKTNNKFIVNCNNGTNKKYLGTYNTEIEAFEVYKRAKENYIKEVANKWKDFIKPNVYEALINYTVEITD